MPLVAALALTAADPQPIAEPLSIQVIEMIAAAYRTGDEATIKAVVGVAKASFPEDGAEIDRLAAGDAAVLALSQKEEQEKEQARIAAATFFEIWKGELEAGAARSTGSTRSLGLYASAKLTRDGLRWRQKFGGRIDVQQTDNVTTTERAIATWQPNYKIDDRLYTYGIAQYEHDRSLGFDHRGTLGGGLGYTAFRGPRFRLDLEGGPAIRYTDFSADAARTTIAGRASVVARWAISPTLAFGQDASLFFEKGDTSASATTTLDTKLLGALKARFSYNIQFEQDAPDGRDALDTITRATLVYSF